MTQTKKYYPQYTRASSWTDIELWYVELIERGLNFQPVLNLVIFIQSTDLKNRIFAYTSMYKHVVSLYNNIESNNEALHIEFDIHVKKWSFKYYPKPFEPIEFERTYTEEQGLEKFQNIIKYLNW
ncbi:MAG TPA: hypothetical protein PKD18_01775 [Saprospiraceae bacterium]|nr:hypothetical protein [Saprospiraceae bacterium]